MTQEEINKISDFTKTETWEIFKKFFKEKEDKLLKYMRTIDLDNEDQKKKYKQMNDRLSAFESLIVEIENIENDKINSQNVQKMNEEIEEFLLPDSEKSIDKDE